METALFNHLQLTLKSNTNKNIQVTGCRQVFGGDINTTYVLTGNGKNYFVKINRIACADMFLKEKNGLTLLRAAKSSLTVPEPILHGTFEQRSYLVMEFLEKGAENKALWQQLATGLAQLHQNKATYFGLDEHNYIGTIAQPNSHTAAWCEFYMQQRILPLMKQAHDQQKCSTADVQLAINFCDQLPLLMPEEQPALLHGDLWSGNRMFTLNGEAAIYDPATYYGHREMDIAMTLLFGGFDSHFYNTYNDVYPLQAGWRERVDICQLYPLLVHLVLFGGHYYNSVKGILKKYA